MENVNTHTLALTLALVGVVIVISALLSGLIERSGLPQVAAFLALGAALGPAGLGAMNLTLDSPTLRVVATLSLALVLFTDAVSLNITEVRRHGALALRVLGPGTMLSALIVTLLGWRLLGLPLAAAAILGAALASTDPVLLRGLLRRRDIPTEARQALRLESGLNDVVLLPVVLVAMAFLNPEQPPGGGGWAKLALDLFILGPGAGVVVGLLAVAALDLVRRRIGVRRDYESLYSLGVAFTAFAAAEMVHGSGFLAAFAAGLTIAALDVELCDCFLEYGEVTAELLLLFTFVLFGTSLIWSGFTVLSGAALLFAGVVIFIRTPVYLLSLAGSGVDQRGRFIIAWFGPRGLSSLLLVLLPVFAGLPGAERLFALCCLVVLVSVVLHGGSPMLLTGLARRRARAAEQQAEQPHDQTTAPPPAAQELSYGDAGDVAACALKPAESRAADGDGRGAEPLEIGRERITLDELRQLEARGEPVVLLDVRTERSYEPSEMRARGAVRMPPEHVVAQARELKLSQEAWLAAYCT